MNHPHEVKIIEVAPRDGLQNETQILSLEDKLTFMDLLAQTGVQSIEATSFVSAQRIPQLQDGEALMQKLIRHQDIEYSALVPNLKGFQRAQHAKVQAIALFTAASEKFNQHNIQCSIQESLERFAPVIIAAKAAKIRVRAYISCALGCPDEGEIKPKVVAQVNEALLKMEVDEVSLADTIGIATPKQTEALLKIIQPMMGKTPLGMHFHDTYGQALANILISLEHDIMRFDTAVAGLGGCPYAKGASGNVATEDVLYLLHGLGVHTGIDLHKMIQAGQWICQKLGKPNQSKVARAMMAKGN